MCLELHCNACEDIAGSRPSKDLHACLVPDVSLILYHSAWVQAWRAGVTAGSGHQLCQFAFDICVEVMARHLRNDAGEA